MAPSCWLTCCFCGVPESSIRGWLTGLTAVCTLLSQGGGDPRRPAPSRYPSYRPGALSRLTDNLRIYNLIFGNFSENLILISWSSWSSIPDPVRFKSKICILKIKTKQKIFYFRVYFSCHLSTVHRKQQKSILLMIYECHKTLVFVILTARASTVCPSVTPTREEIRSKTGTFRRNLLYVQEVVTHFI